jgi:isopenicillin N synthase-like dioxygenase
MGLSTIPVIDLVASPGDDLAHALAASSCALVVGHGVDRGLHDEFLAITQEFFALPAGEKRQVRWPGNSPWRGWLPYFEGGADLSAGTRAVPLEKFEMQLSSPGRVAEADGDRPGCDAPGDDLLDTWLAGFDSWPARPAALRLIWARYYRELAKLANRIVAGIVSAFDLPADQLEAWTTQHYANLVVNHYFADGELGSAAAGGTSGPSTKTDPPGRLHPHTDIGGLTVLWADDAAGGLEVKLPGQARWTEVAVPPDAYLIQAGDLLACWTNNLIRPNIHRVANGTSRRTSLVYFQYPEMDTLVAPAPSCVSDEHPACASLLAGAHLQVAVETPAQRYAQMEKVHAGL